jgi:hypothetical protein
MANTTGSTSGGRTRTVLTPAQRREKAAAGIGDNVQKAANLLINVADGFVAAGQRDRAKRTLDLWGAVVDLDAPEPEPEVIAPNE